MSSPTTQSSLSARFFQLGPVRQFDDWIHAMPHPPVVVEIAGPHVAVARSAPRGGHRLEDLAVEPLPVGAVMPSTLETNVVEPEAVRSALREIFARVPIHGASVALLVPDLVVRVFILPFDNLPRRASEALPLLRWRLKKSVPFDVEETVVSWMRQDARGGGLEVVTAVARQPIVREYEALIESLGARVGVVLSSTLATVPLLEERGATLLVRLCGKTLTTVIVRGANLCLYRSTEMQGDAALEPQAILDEVFPAVAYYQDFWGETIDRARLSGFGATENSLVRALAQELRIPAGSMSDAVSIELLAGRQAKDVIPRGLDALLGWTMNRKS